MISTLASVTVKVTPTASLPGSNAIGSILNGLDFIVILAAVAGLLLSAIFVAVGKHGGNGQMLDRGKIGLIIAVVAAVIATAAPAIINWATGVGQTVH
jgi:hypothetical protein